MVEGTRAASGGGFDRAASSQRPSWQWRGSCRGLRGGSKGRGMLPAPSQPRWRPAVSTGLRVPTDDVTHLRHRRIATAELREEDEVHGRGADRRADGGGVGRHVHHLAADDVAQPVVDEGLLEQRERGSAVRAVHETRRHEPHLYGQTQRKSASWARPRSNAAAFRWDLRGRRPSLGLRRAASSLQMLSEEPVVAAVGPTRRQI